MKYGVRRWYYMNTIRSIDSLEAIKMSLQCEYDMQEYYQKATSLMQNDDAVAILNGLAEKETTHKKRLIRAYSHASGKKLLYLNLGKKHKIGILLKCVDDPNDAIRNAKKNEKELKSFYLTVSRRLLEPELRQLFRELALEQEQHYALLESSFQEPLQLDEDPTEVEASILNELTSA
jgi:rubrerythrin